MNDMNIDKLLTDSINELKISDVHLSETSIINLPEFYTMMKSIPSNDFILLLEAGMFSKIADKINPHRAIRREAPMISVTDPKGNSTKYFAFPDLQVSTQDGAGRAGHDEILDKIIQDETAKGLKVAKVPTGDVARLAADKQITTVKMPPDNQKEAVIKALYNLGQTVQNKYKEVQAYNYMSANELEAIKQEVNKSLGAVTNAANAEEQAADPKSAAAGLEQQISANEGNNGATPNGNPQSGQPAPGNWVNDKLNAAYGKTPTTDPNFQPIASPAQVNGQVGSTISYTQDGKQISGKLISSNNVGIVVKPEGQGGTISIPFEAFKAKNVSISPLKPLATAPAQATATAVSPENPAQATAIAVPNTQPEPTVPASAPISPAPGTQMTAQVNPTAAQMPSNGAPPIKQDLGATKVMSPEELQARHQKRPWETTQESYNPYLIGRELL